MFEDRENEIIADPEENVEDKNPGKELDLTPQERRWVALGALKSGLLIGAAYLVGLGLVIGLLLLIWNH